MTDASAAGVAGYEEHVCSSVLEENRSAQFNGTDPTHIQGSGEMSGFSFTFANSKLEANQTPAGTFMFSGSPEAAGAALERSGFQNMHGAGANGGMSEYRTFGNGVMGANAGHFNVQMIQTNPRESLPSTSGNMHFGEHSPLGLGAFEHIGSEVRK